MMREHCSTADWRTPRHNAHPLDPRGDNTVSRIVGRRETEAIRRIEAAVDAAIEDLARRFALRLAKSPKLARAELEDFARTAYERVASSGLALHISHTEDLKRASSPKASMAFVSLTAHSIRQLPDGRYEGAAAVNLDVLTLERSCLELVHMPLGVEWRQHVADRFHLRSGDRGDAHAALGSALGPFSTVLDLLCRLSADEDPRLNVPVPVADGLVVGMPGLEGGMHPIRVIEAVEARKGLLRNVGNEVCFAGTTFHPTRQPAGWTGVTYKSAEMIGAAGRAYAEGFRELDREVAAWKADVEDVATPTPAQAAGRDALIGRAQAFLDGARRTGASRREPSALPQPAPVDMSPGRRHVARHHAAFRKGYLAATEAIEADAKDPCIRRRNGEAGIAGRILMKEHARFRP